MKDNTMIQDFSYPMENVDINENDDIQANLEINPNDDQIIENQQFENQDQINDEFLIQSNANDQLDVTNSTTNFLDNQNQVFFEDQNLQNYQEQIEGEYYQEYLPEYETYEDNQYFDQQYNEYYKEEPNSNIFIYDGVIYNNDLNKFVPSKNNDLPLVNNLKLVKPLTIKPIAFKRSDFLK